MVMNEESLNRKFIDITNLIQQEFQRNVDKYGEKIKCRRGCSKCCHQIFRITPVDSFIIQNYLSGLPHNARNILKNKASEYYKELTSRKDQSYENFQMQCPALGIQGECTIYEGRPVICRRFGPPVHDYKNPSKIYSCDLNFKEGEEIIDDELIPNQTEIGKKWDELKTAFNVEMNLNENASTTIAEAILNA